jgi:hypothetical protein
MTCVPGQRTKSEKQPKEKPMSTLIRATRSFFTLRPRRTEMSTRVAITGTVAVVLAQFLDFISTTAGIRAGATETNPIMAAFVHNPFAFFGIKAVATLFLCWATWKRPAATLTIAILYLLVGYSNLYVIAQL